MKLKDGVSLAGLSLAMRPVLMAAAKIWADNGQELVVTSGLDGVHAASSLHYYGYALDFRTRYFEENTKLLVLRQLSDELRKYHNDYRVISHDTHIHVEYRQVIAYQDIKNGTT